MGFAEPGLIFRRPLDVVYDDQVGSVFERLESQADFLQSGLERSGWIGRGEVASVSQVDQRRRLAKMQVKLDVKYASDAGLVYHPPIQLKRQETAKPLYSPAVRFQ